MEFPVDLLANVSQAELEQSAHTYMNDLLFSNPYSPEHLTLSDSTQVTIDISSVGFVPLYGSSDKQRILALFSPSDPLTAVALYLLDQWWVVDDILKTADPARDGAVEVETLGERIALYILNRVIYRAKEMSSDELPFLCHGENDHAKILWNNGEAVGFYSVKLPDHQILMLWVGEWDGSQPKAWASDNLSYQLPVMDSIFVRKCHRGKGFGLQMLEDFVLSFKDDCLGLRYPLSTSMYKVCEKYLSQYPGDADLLWEVESIGGPNQRTNIANKIQTMDLSAVSKSLSFTEESLVITEVTEKDVVMEALTTQIKEAESMECTVEIVEEVTVLRTTKEDELPVTARGRSSGSKRRSTGEKITEDKSEKVIRIEDIEAEAPREEQVSAQQHTKTHSEVSELVQTEGVFSVAPEEIEEDVADITPKEEAATMSDKPATVLASHDREEADITSAPTAEEPQEEDVSTRDLNNTCHDSQIRVENVASEIEEAKEECPEEDTAVLVVSEEVLEVHKETETLSKVGEETRLDVTAEKLEETVQQELSISTHVASEGGEAGKTGRTVVKTIKTVASETPRRRSQRHRKPEEEVKEETTAQHEGKVLRKRAIMSTPTPKYKYPRHSQKINEELEKEVGEVPEETTEVVQELAVTEGEEPEEIPSIKEDAVAVEELREEEKQQEDEQEETEKQEEPGVEDTALEGSPTELPDAADTAFTQENVDEKVSDEPEKEQTGEEVETSGIQDKQQVSDDEIEEPPIIQKRAVRGRQRITPKPKSTKQSERHQEQEEEHMDEADLRGGGLVSEEEAEEKATGQVEQEETVDKAEEETTEESTAVEAGTISEADEAAEDVIPSTELNMEERKEVQEDEKTEAVSAMEADKGEEADGEIQEPDTVTAASETEVLDEAALSTAEEPQTKDIGSEIPKLQEATVVLVDLKTTSHHLCVQEAEETPSDGVCAAPEDEQVEPIVAAEEKEVSSCVAEEQSPEPEMLVLGEDDGAVEQESSTEKSVDAAAETDEKEELEEDNSHKEKEESVDGEKGEAEEAPFIETRVLRSGRKVVKASYQQQEEDNTGEVITEKKEAETGTVEVEGEMEVMTKDAATVVTATASETSTDIGANIPVVDDAEENPSPADVDEEMSLEEEEAPVATRALRSGIKTVAATPRHKMTRNIKLVDEQDAENSEEEEEPAVTTRTLRKGRVSASATPISRRTRKQIQVEEQKGGEESRSVEETGEEEEAGNGAAVEKTDTEETFEEELGEKVNEEAVPERVENSEPEIEVEEGKAMEDEVQDVVEKQSEAITETFAEWEPEASGEECDERKADMGGLEVELPPVAVIRSLRSGGKTSKALPKTRSRRSKKQQEEEEEEEEEGASASKSADGDETTAEPRILRRGRLSVCSKQVQKEEEGPNESAEDAEVVVLGSAEEPPTEGDEGKIPEDETEVEKEEPVSVDMEKEMSEEEPMPVTEEEEETAGVSAVADNLVEEGETCTPLPSTNSAILTPSEEEATASAEEQQCEDMLAQLSDLQRVTVVLVDLKKTHQEVLEETAAVEEGLPAAEVEEEQREETMAEEHAPCSPVEMEKTELEKVVMEEEGVGDKVEDADTKEDTGEKRAEETIKEDEAKSVDDEEEEEEEEEVNKTRTRRSRRQAVRAMPRGKLAKSRQKKSEEEQEEISEIREEEPAVQERVLRTGRKSISGKQRTRTQKTLQEKQEEEEEGGEESAAVEEKEAEEVVEQVEGQEQEEVERLEEKNATQQEENVEAETGIEKGDTGAEEAVTLSEEGQAISTDTAADEDAEASLGQSADEGKTSDSAAEEAVATQDTAQGEQSPSTSEVALLTEKDDEAEGVSEVEEAPVIETRVLRSGEKTVRAAARSKATNEQEADTTEDEAAVEPRILRRGRRSAAATPIRKSKRTHTHCETEEEGEDKTTTTEEIQAEETKEVIEEAEEQEENKDGKTEEKNEEEATAQKEENSEENEQEGTVVDKSSDTDEPAVEPRVLRRGRRSAPSTPRRKSKRARTHCDTEEEAEEETPPAEDVQVEETEAIEKEDSDEKIHEKDGEEPVAQKEENTEPEVEMEKVEAVAEEQSAVSDTSANGQEETPAGESAEEAPNTDEGKVTDEEEAPVVVETRVLRSGGKAVKAMPRSKTTKSLQEENEQEGTAVDKSSDADEAAVETRALRKGRRSAAATPRHKSKRARTQCETEEKGEEDTPPAEETEGEEEEADKALPEEEGEKAEEEEENMAMGMKKGEVESTAGGESAVGDAEQVKDASTEEAAAMEEEEEEDNSVAAVDETGTDMVKAEETNSAEKKETTVTEKSTAATESHTAIAEEEALVAEESVLTEEEAPAVTTRTLRSKTKNVQATPSRRSRQKEPVESLQQEEENLEDEKTQEVHQLADDSPENGDLHTQAQEETDEKSPTGQEGQPPAERNAEDQAKMDDGVVEPAGQQLEEGTREENLENNVGVVESTSEKGNNLNLVLDTDEEVETAGQEDEEDEHYMSEEVEPIVIGKKVLRGRTVPSLIITPQSKSRRQCSAEVQKSEESLSDDEQSPQSAQRSVRKRKSSEVTPTRKSKRLSRV